MMNKIKEFIKDEGGQTSTEYILLVAIVALVVIKFGNTLKAKMEGLTNSVFQKADNVLDGFDTN